MVIAPLEAPRKLAISKQGAAIGAAAGALAGFILDAFNTSEIVGHHLSPSMIVLLGLIVGGGIGFVRGYWALLALDALLWIVFLVVAYTPLMSRLAPRWVRSDPLPASADAIVVLSASVLSDTALNADGTARLLSGLELFQRGVAPRIFTTENELHYPDGVRSTTEDQARLIKLGGATTAWTVLQGTRTTRDEALQSAVKLPKGARSVVVVTSPLHTRRACATFETLGFKVACYPARARDHATWYPITSGDRIAAFGDYLYERLGMIKYRWKHWIS
jgi:uncharacterized SAM-binding protein YcdF (DUF218 family)